MTTPRFTSMEELENHAAAGDARAQYHLAAHLSSRGQRVEADRLLTAAADQGYGDALYTLATRKLDDAGMTEAAGMLARAADAGSTPAQRLLGVLHANGFGVEQDWKTAFDYVIAAAKSGAPGALREIAMLLFSFNANDPDGAALLKLAAPNDPVAGAVAVRRAACGRRGADRPFAEQFLKLLQQAGYQNAGPLADALYDAPHTDPNGEAHQPDWSRITEKLPNLPKSVLAQPEKLCEAPAARVYRNAFLPEECEYVIASSARLLAPSTVSDPRSGSPMQDEYRTSLTAILGVVDLDLALTHVNRRLAALAGRPAETAESLGVLFYAPGKEYRPHYDWLPPGPEYDRGGQRVTTALFYLNSEYEGGETHFLTPDIRFRGGAGDVLVFHNALADGSPDKNARHAGLAVTEGAKWLGSTWYREKKYSR